MKLLKKIRMLKQTMSQKELCKIFRLLLLFIVCGQLSFNFLYANKKIAPELAEKELRGTEKIEFENRSNRLATQELRIEQIEHGKRLVRKLFKNNYVKDNEIVLQRIHSNQGDRLGADVLLVGKEANFGHINGLLRLLSGYLMESFEYDVQEARMLSNIIIFYNAMIRKNIEEVKSRYAQSVVTNLNPQHVGIDRKFSNWAGETQIIIPLQSNLVRPGGKEMSTSELRQKVEKDLDNTTLENLKKTQTSRLREDKSRLQTQDSQIQKDIQNEEQNYHNIVEQLRHELAKPPHEQDIEKIKYLKQQKNISLQKLEKYKHLQKALRHQLEGTSPHTIISQNDSAAVANQNTVSRPATRKSQTAEMSVYQSKDETYVNSDTKFSLTATDKSSAVDYTEYKIDDSKFKKYQSPFSLSKEGKGEEGSHVIVYRSIDVVGNIEANKSYLVVVDDSGPHISISAKDKKKIYNQDNKMFVQKHNELLLFATDNLSGVKNIYYRINNENIQNYTAPIKMQEAGEFVIEYGAQDKLGNKTTDFLTVEVDDQAPVVEVLYNGKTLSREKILRTQRGKGFQIFAFDNQSGVKQVFFRTEEQEKFVLFTKEIFFSENGQHVLEVKAVDNVGNESAIERFTFIQDDEPPETLLTPLP